MIRLEEYGPGLVQQGYTTIQDICTVSIEDLEDIGFYRLGHQKRLLLAIKKIKEIIQGSKMVSVEESDCIFKTKEIQVPSLQSGSIRHDKFSSFHYPLPTNAMPYKAPLYSSPYTTFGLQDDLPPPLAQDHPSPLAIDLPSPLAQELPEPMQPLHYPGPGMTRSHDPHLILRSLSGGGIFQAQSSVKTKPVAMVAASARISEASCHPRAWGEEGWYEPKNNQIKHQEECPGISAAHHSHAPHIIRRNSLTCLPMRGCMEEGVNDKARTTAYTDTDNHEEGNLLRSKSGGPSSFNSTLARRNRSSNLNPKSPEVDKSPAFHKQTSVVQSPSCTLERSRSRYYSN